MADSALTPEQYLAALPADRREALEAVRAAIQAAVPEGVEAGMQYGMLGWYVPHGRYPRGYHCDPAQPLPYVGLGSQKRHLALYLHCVYADPGARDALIAGAAARGVKVDMGKSCVRFKRAADLPLDLIQDAIRRSPTAAFIERYEAGVPASVKKKWT